jgi:hypothetical protein
MNSVELRRIDPARNTAGASLDRCAVAHAAMRAELAAIS